MADDWREKLKAQLIRHEGLRLRLYRCPAGKLTIGVGRNIEDNGITTSEAMQMLDFDISRANVHVNLVLMRYGIDRALLTPVRKAVLINMAFNMGMDGLMGFKRMFGAIKKGDYALAAKELLDSKYARQVGHRAGELARQLETGQYEV